MSENLLSSQNEEKTMTLIDHISELRFRIVRAAAGVFVGLCVCWGFSEKIFDFVRRPIQPYLPDGGLVFTAPIDKFMAHIKIAFVCGALISAPYWLYHFWKFISPALYKNEKKVAAGFVFFGTFQFALGMAFSYWIVLPMAFKFLMNFGGSVDKPMITIDHYLGFFAQTSLVFGLAFEMPVVISFLGMAGILSQRFLREKRRIAVVGIAVVSAIAAPPDALSMLLLLIPLWLLFEISIIVVGLFEKRRANKET